MFQLTTQKRMPRKIFKKPESKFNRMDHSITTTYKDRRDGVIFHIKTGWNRTKIAWDKDMLNKRESIKKTSTGDILLYKGKKKIAEAGNIPRKAVRPAGTKGFKEFISEYLKPGKLEKIAEGRDEDLVKRTFEDKAGPTRMDEFWQGASKFFGVLKSKCNN